MNDLERAVVTTSTVVAPLVSTPSVPQGAAGTPARSLVVGYGSRGGCIPPGVIDPLP